MLKCITRNSADSMRSSSKGMRTIAKNMHSNADILSDMILLTNIAITAQSFSCHAQSDNRAPDTHSSTTCAKVIRSVGSTG